MAIRKITAEDVEKFQKAINNCNIELQTNNFKLKYADLMINEGLMSNYLEKMEEMKLNKRKAEYQIEFNKKVIQTYLDIIAKGEIDDSLDKDEDAESC